MPTRRTPTGHAGIERVAIGKYRIGIQIYVEDPDTHKRVRKWIRETHTYDPAIPEENHLQLALADQRYLKSLHTEPAADVSVTSPPPPDEITVAQLVRLWQRVELSQHAPDSRKTANSFIALHILPHLGMHLANSLTPMQINAWKGLLQQQPQRNHTGKTLSARSAKNIYITLATIYNWGRTSKLITNDPFDQTHSPKVRRKPVTVLTDEQCVSLLRQLQQEENMSFRACVLLALLFGLRLGEVQAINRYTDINWTDCTVSVRTAVKQTPETGRVIGAPKTDDSIRIIAGDPAVMALLDETCKYLDDCKRQLGDRYHDSGLLICNFDGTPYNKDTPSKQWHRYAARNGYPNVTFHHLRTSCATILLANNIDAVAVASRLGHSSAVTTLQYYAMVVAKRERDSATIMGNIVRNAQQQMPSQPQITSMEVTHEGSLTLYRVTLSVSDDPD